ncbi:hypothetical protein PoB_001918700, partial [Plakobranchus ocellatus]
MESHASISQSLQASVIIQQQQQQQHLKQQRQHAVLDKRQQPRLNVWQQVKLTAALIGVESSTAFEQVYTYL